MNIGQIISWILSNTGVITSVIQAIETIASELQNVHGNTSLDAYAKAFLAAIEGFFSSIGANTTPTEAEKTTIAPITSTVAAITKAPGPVTVSAANPVPEVPATADAPAEPVVPAPGSVPG